MMTVRTAKIIVLSFVLGITAFPAAAQTNYLRGYYVDVNSDTVHGYIERNADRKMEKLIRFKQTQESKPIALHPGNTKSVEIDNKNFYESISMEIDGVRESGFFRVRIIGRLTLFIFDGNYLVRKDGGELYDITKRTKKVVGRNRQTYLQTDPKGMGLLKVLTADCPSVGEQYIAKQYKDNPDYINIVNIYNRCFSELYIDAADIFIPKWVDVGIQGSLTATGIDFSNTATMYNAEFGTSFSGTGGVFFSVFFPDLGDNIRMLLEPSFGAYNGYSNFLYNQVTNDVYLRYSYIRAPVYFRDFFTRSLFVDLGFANLFPVNQASTWRQETVSSSGAIFTSDGPVYELKPHFGFMAGVGARMNFGGIPAQASLRFSQTWASPHIVLDETNDQPAVKWLELNLGVQLTRKR